MNFRTMLKQLRIKALTQLLAASLIPDLEAEGFSFSDLLLALAEWADTNPQWRDAVYHLEQAATPPNQLQHEVPSEQPKTE